MVTLLLITILFAILVIAALVLICIFGAIFSGGLLVILDVLIGISPFLLIGFIIKKVKKKKKRRKRRS